MPQSPRWLQWDAPNSLPHKIAPIPWQSSSHLIHPSLDRPQTAFRSNQPFFYNSPTRQTVTDTPTDRWKSDKPAAIAAYALLYYSNVANNKMCYKPVGNLVHASPLSKFRGLPFRNKVLNQNFVETLYAGNIGHHYTKISENWIKNCRRSSISRDPSEK